MIRFRIVSASRWLSSAEILFFTREVVKISCIYIGRWVGSFSEGRPLGWDLVAAGNRAGDGMACNNSDRRLRRKQGTAVGAAASKMRAVAKQMLGAATRISCLRRKFPTRWPSAFFRQILQKRPIIFSCISVQVLAIPLVSDYNGYNDVLIEFW